LIKVYIQPASARDFWPLESHHFVFNIYIKEGTGTLFSWCQDTSDPRHSPHILAPVPKCLTDTLAPRKSLWHRATLDQAMSRWMAVLH